MLCTVRPRDTGEDRRGEETSIREFLGKMVRLAGAAPGFRLTLRRVEGELLDLLKNQFLRKEYWAHGFTDALDDRIHAAEREVQEALNGAAVAGRLLMQAFECLYVLRIQVFHGCAKEGSSANRASLEPAVVVVKRLVPLFWAVMKRAGADEDWGRLSYPAWDRPGPPPKGGRAASRSGTDARATRRHILEESWVVIILWAASRRREIDDIVQHDG